MRQFAIFAALFALAGGPSIAAEPSARVKAVWTWNDRKPTFESTIAHVEAGGTAILSVGVPALQIEGITVFEAKELAGLVAGHHLCYRAGKELQTVRFLVEPTAEVIVQAIRTAAEAQPTTKKAPSLGVAPAVLVPGHSHKCRSCGEVWAHPDEGLTFDDHFCPVCGREQRRQFEENLMVPAVAGTVAPKRKSAPSRPKRVRIGTAWYDQYADGTLVACSA